MAKVKTYYLVKIADDETRKPRIYFSEDELEYGDKVKTFNKNGEAEGYVVGTIECSQNTIKNFVKGIGGYFPLAKCEYDGETEDIFVLMGICNEEITPRDILECALLDLDEQEEEANEERD